MATFDGQGKPGQCHAKAKTTQKQCTRPALRGANVCRYHGGSAPQVKASARLRLAILVDPSIDILSKIIKPGSGKYVKRELQVRVAQDILDRNGLKSKDEIVLTHDFNEERFSNMSDTEIAQLVALARKASSQHDATEKQK